jgi:hypothetical protein
MPKLHTRLRQSMTVLLIAFASSCSAADLMGTPSTQEWLLIDNQNNLGRITTTYLTVDKGGAISQGAAAYKMDVTATCSMTVTLSGNWAGTAVHMTSTGSNCNARYILTMDGTTNGAYGTADAASGTYNITYAGIWGGGESGTWKASFIH